MKRKRQQDFQKTKLKVGRRLPKGQNVTNTSFKTKKIITHDQLKADPGEITLKELFKHLSSNNANTKVEALNRINKYIAVNGSTLSLYFPDVIKKLGSILLESDPKVREVAIQVTSSCLKLLSNIQLRSFFVPITSYLNCMMTHVSTPVRRDSLKLVHQLLIFHPDVICQSTRVLTNLLNMISSFHKGVKSRRLNDHISSVMTSCEWRSNIFGCMYMFLKAMLQYKCNKDRKEEEDEKEVYWDGEKPLFLPLYINGGVNPVKLEDIRKSYMNVESNMKDIKKFITELVPLTSDAIKGEIPHCESRKFEVVDVFDPAVIKYLNNIVQVLCSIGELFQTDASFRNDMDPSLFVQLKNIVCYQLLRGFPYIQYVPSDGNKGKKQNGESKSLPLNLGICYLYSVFVLDSESSKLKAEKAVLSYLVDMFRNCNKLCNESIDFILKTSKILIECKHINTSYKNAILLGLYGILDVYKISPTAKKFYAFFMYISLEYDLKHLLKSEGMITWFKLLYKELTFMKESGLINIKFLKYIRQICARKYAPFMELISQIEPENLIDLLKHDHEELQLTVIQLICSLDKLPSEFLQKIADTIHEESFSIKTAIRLIRLLHLRFSRPGTSVLDTITFAKFLLNLGCDTQSVFLPPPETKPTSYSKILTDIQMIAETQKRFRFTLYLVPNRWQRHHSIFEVCLECLLLYSSSKQVAQCINLFIKDLMITKQILPVNTVIALLHLRSKIGYIYHDQQLLSMYLHLIYSSLIYISVVSNDPQADIKGGSLPELQRSLNLTPEDGDDVLQLFEKEFGMYEENERYFALRILCFLSRKDVFTSEHSQCLYAILGKIHPLCRPSKHLDPLWKTLCKIWGFI